jgi:hypothetical protein
MRAHLQKFAGKDSRVNSAQLKNLLAGLNDLEVLHPLNFSWPTDGAFQCEVRQRGEGLPPAETRWTIDQVAGNLVGKMRRLHADADAEDEQVAHGARPPEDAPEHGVLLTDAQFRQRARERHVANARVSAVHVGCFIAFRPPAAEDQTESKMPFWLGRIRGLWRRSRKAGWAGWIRCNLYTPYTTNQPGAKKSVPDKPFGWFVCDKKGAAGVEKGNVVDCTWQDVIHIFKDLSQGEKGNIPAADESPISIWIKNNRPCLGRKLTDKLLVGSTKDDDALELGWQSTNASCDEDDDVDGSKSGKRQPQLAPPAHTGHTSSDDDDSSSQEDDSDYSAADAKASNSSKRRKCALPGATAGSAAAGSARAPAPAARAGRGKCK